MQRMGSLIAAGVLTLGAWTLPAQTAARRLPSTIDTQSFVALRGSLSPRVVGRQDLGRLDGGARLTGVTLFFQPTAAQKAELDALVAAQQTPGSPSYHQWLTPAEYASRFGLDDADLAVVRNWLEQQGFTVERVSNSHTAIGFSGTVGQIETAFKTEMHRFSVGGQTHFANATQLSIPSALSGVVLSVRNLDSFRPRSRARLRTPQSSQVQPSFTSSQSGSHYLTPLDVATIYDINAAYSSGYTGTGQSIAVVGQSSVVLSDIENFQSAAGLTVKDPTPVLVPGSGTSTVYSGDEAESELDLEYSGGIARGATIYFVYTGNGQNYNIWDALLYAVDTKIAPVISMSYGACEPDIGSSSYATLEAILEQGASQGQSIIVASGDDGSTACYDDVTGTTVTAAEQQLAADYPASSAYVTGLGGTEFTAAAVAAGNTTYWQSTSGSDVIGSAKSYMPEQVWNDDSATVGASSGAAYALSAGGGGISIYTARPTWQKSVTGIPSGSYRLVPDVSLASSPNNAGYLYCSSDKSTGVTGSCSNGFRDANNQYLTVAGGTSFAAPIFAGMVAIVNQKLNSNGLGLINPTLYSLAADSATYASAFHDITSGGNECTAGSSYCSTAGASAYYAGTGYDEATGLGSVDFYNLLMAWPTGSSSSLAATTTTLAAASGNPASGANDVITITVAPQSSSISTVPTGTLTIAVDGATQTTSLGLSSGSAQYTFSSTLAGAHVITAAYSGNSLFASSSGSLTVTVGSSSGTGSGGTGSSTVTVTPSGGYTGTVDFALSATNSYLVSYACYDISPATVSSSSSVSQTLVIYTGSANCSSSAAQGSGLRSFRAAAPSPTASASRLPVAAAALGFCGILFAGLVGWRFRRLRALCCVLALAVLGCAFSGCGGSTASSNSSKSFSLAVSPSTVTVSAGTSGIPTGSYTLTVIGTDSSTSSLSALATMTLTVN